VPGGCFGGHSGVTSFVARRRLRQPRRRRGELVALFLQVIDLGVELAHRQRRHRLLLWCRRRGAVLGNVAVGASGERLVEKLEHVQRLLRSLRRSLRLVVATTPPPSTHLVRASALRMTDASVRPPLSVKCEQVRDVSYP
jgi:hypothetical protein